MSAISEGRMNTFAPAAAAAIFGEGRPGAERERGRGGEAWLVLAATEGGREEVGRTLLDCMAMCMYAAEAGTIQQFFLRDSAEEVIPEYSAYRTPMGAR